MASTYITRTVSSAGNQKTWTLSFWFKRTSDVVNGDAYIFSYSSDGGGNNPRGAIHIEDTNQTFKVQFNPTGSAWTTHTVTSRKIRDVSAWYHIVVKCDTTQATDSNRLKFYINGENQTLDSYPAQNFDTGYNSAVKHTIGRYEDSDSSHLDGLLAHVHWTDGYAYDASDFGESDSVSSIWKPKTAPSVTYGTNGFFFKFENSGNMDLDSSGNNLTFTTGGTLTQNVDTPSNNFATLNPLDISRNATQNRTFSNGNLTVTTTDYIAANGSLGASSGKFYWEFKLINSSASNIYAGGGVIKFDGWDGQGQGGSGANTYIYATSGQKVNNGSGSSFGATLTAGDIVGVALDLDNGFLYFSKNGTWQNSGVPTSGASGTGNAFSSLSGTFAAHLSDPNDAQDHDFSINFGQGYFGTTQVASAGTAPSEGGIFEYDCPSGYQALCTKGINSF